MNVPEVFETSCLRLRKPVIEDAESIFTRYAQDLVVTRYLIWLPHKRIEETREFLNRCLDCWNTGSAFPWVITGKNDNQVMGMIELRVDRHTANLGYVLARDFWGNGYMPEAAGAIVDWALSQPEIYRLWAVGDIENKASARVLEKIGMQREGTLRRL